MAKLIGAQRMVLQAILELPKDSTGFSTDAHVAQNTQIALEDVRNWLETLEGEDYVNVARTEVGLRASITAKGRLALKQYEFQRATAIVPPKERPPSWLAKAVAWVTIAALLFAALGWFAWSFRDGETTSTPRPSATPSTPKLSATPSSLKLRAGSSQTIIITHDPGWKPTVTPVDQPEGITVEPESRSEDLELFRVAAKLNTKTSPTPRPLTFRATAARGGQTTSAPGPLRVDVTVEPPEAALPPDCRVAPGARYVRISDKIVADRIERVFSDDPEMPVVFRLIERVRHNDPNPFYIMEYKVWNGLFARFAAERPEAVEDSKWTSFLKGDPTTPENVWLPVMSVTAKEAQAFAIWLGGRLRGRLPSCAQWDKAAGAGVNDRGGRMGPFEGTWVPGQKDRRIAVGRKVEDGPVPVNREDITDISIFGVRDMAGNGLEWTRDGHAEIRILRGWRFTKDYPWKFEFLDEERIEVAAATSSNNEIGFRVVLEPDL